MPARPRITRLITGGIPEIHGDKFRPDDYILEETFNQGLVSDVWENLSNPPCIISGLTVTQGSGSTIDISSGYLIIKDTQNPTINLHDFDGTSLASAVTIPTKYVLVYFPGVTGFSDFTPTTDGTTVHYVTAQIKEIAVTGGERQNAATPATAYDFIVANSLEISVSTTSPTSDDFQLDSFTAVAGPIYTLSGIDREEDAVLKPLNDKFQLASDLITFLGSSNNLGIDLSQLSGNRTLSLPDRNHQIGGVEDWVTTTVYYENELVRNGGLYYRCTSTGDGQTATGSFATDLGNNWWELASTEIVDNLSSMSTTAALSANQGRVLNNLINANIPTGYIYGLELQYDSATLVTVKAGVAKSDDDTDGIVLASDMQKSLSSTWAAGDGSGGREATWTASAGDDVYIYLIKNSTTSDVDVLLSNTYPFSSVANKPSGFDLGRFVGALVLKSGTAEFQEFNWIGGYIHLVDNVTMFSQSGTSINVVVAMGGVPVGFETEVDMNVIFYSTGNGEGISITHPDVNNPITLTDFPSRWEHTATVDSGWTMRAFTDSSAQLRIRTATGGSRFAFARLNAYKISR